MPEEGEEKQSLTSGSLFDPHDSEEDVDLILDRIKQGIVGYAKRLATERDVPSYHDVVLVLFDRDRDGEALRHPTHGQVALDSVGGAGTSDGRGHEGERGILLHKQKSLGAQMFIALGVVRINRPRLNDQTDL